MRAAVIDERNRLSVRDVPDPVPAPGRLVLRVTACGICGSDLHMVQAGLTTDGFLLGHEASGIVEEVGSGVDGFTPGDPVAVYPLEHCGTCAACLVGAHGRCQIGLGATIGLGMRPGAFAERLDVAPAQLEKLPDTLDPAHGAMAEPLAVALHGLRRSRFSAGMSVGVIGCGPIGLCAVLAAKALGAAEVWACDTNPFRAELAGRAGADATGSAPRDADIVVEAAGAPGTIDLAVRAARSGGQVVLLAVNLTGDAVTPMTLVTKEVDIVPGIACNRSEFAEATQMISSGLVDVGTIITRRVGLDEVDEAFFGLLDGAPEGKVLVTP